MGFSSASKSRGSSKGDTLRTSPREEVDEKEEFVEDAENAEDVNPSGRDGATVSAIDEFGKDGRDLDMNREEPTEYWEEYDALEARLDSSTSGFWPHAEGLLEGESRKSEEGNIFGAVG